MVTRGKGGKQEVDKYKEEQIYGDRNRFDFGWLTKCNIQILHY